MRLTLRDLSLDSFPVCPLTIRLSSSCRIVYLGLTLGLRTVSFLLCISGFALLKRHVKREEKYALTNGSAELETLRKEENSSVHCEQFIPASDCNPDRETRLWASAQPLFFWCRFMEHHETYRGSHTHPVHTFDSTQSIYLYRICVDGLYDTWNESHFKKETTLECKKNNN